MHAGHDDVMAPERAEAPRTVVSTTVYDLIAAVAAEVAPGEEACVAPIVAHLLRAGHAQFLWDVDVERLCTDLAPPASRQKNSASRRHARRTRAAVSPSGTRPPGEARTFRSMYRHRSPVNTG